jgi:hypothetical protein
MLCPSAVLTSAQKGVDKVRTLDESRIGSAHRRWAAGLLLMGLGLGISAAGAQPAADSVIRNWPAMPQKAARQLIARYGAPQEVTASMVRWRGNGVWKRTIVHREEVPHHFPMPHTDFLEQTIDYRVPPGKYDELARYDGSVIVERTKGEMSARCDKEELNILALNLANDIVTGKRSVDDAREFYAMTAMAFKNGERPPYTQRLMFDVRRSSTADPDREIRPGLSRR